jgi:hypothetical protein
MTHNRTASALGYRTTNVTVTCTRQLSGALSGPPLKMSVLARASPTLRGATPFAA